MIETPLILGTYSFYPLLCGFVFQGKQLEEQSHELQLEQEQVSNIF